MRVRRYFAFVDLCGFTRFTEVHGDVESVAVLTGFRSLVRDIASEHGVRVAKWLGDGAMFVSTDGPALSAALLELGCLRGQRIKLHAMLRQESAIADDEASTIDIGHQP